MAEACVIEEEECHEVMVSVSMPATVTDLALCDALQLEYDEGEMPSGGFVLKDKTAEGDKRTVRIYFALVLGDLTAERERGHLEAGLTHAITKLRGYWNIESFGPAKPFSQIEAY